MDQLEWNLEEAGKVGQGWTWEGGLLEGLAFWPWPRGLFQA
jgi:hypothetical protein